MSLTNLFNRLRLTQEDLLLTKKFEMLPLEFENKIDTFMEKYEAEQEYEKCIIVQEYKEFIKQKQK